MVEDEKLLVEDEKMREDEKMEVDGRRWENSQCLSSNFHKTNTWQQYSSVDVVVNKVGEASGISVFACNLVIL